MSARKRPNFHADLPTKLYTQTGVWNSVDAAIASGAQQR